MAEISQVIIIPPGIVDNCRKKVIIHIPAQMKETPVLLANLRQINRYRGGGSNAQLEIDPRSNEECRSALQREIDNMWHCKMHSKISNWREVRQCSSRLDTEMLNIQRDMEILEELERKLLRIDLIAYQTNRKKMVLNIANKLTQYITPYRNK